MVDNPHIGSSFDDFLEEEGILQECELTAIKRVIAWQVEQAMQKQGLSKSDMAKQMNTSRASLNRLLDPDNVGVTLQTIQAAASTVGKRVKIELVDVDVKDHLESSAC